MSQHDMDIANQGFPSFRADLNNALEALVSNSSGDGEPAVTYPGMWWFETDTDLLKIRNENNDSWIILGSLNQTTGELELRSGVIQAFDSDGVQIKTDDGTTRLTISDSGDATFTGTVQAANISSSGSLSNRNVVINGNFGVNQRDVSGTVVLSAGQYGHDRFKAGASGCTYTFSTSGNITTLTISAGSLIQIVEGVNLVSDTYVLSWSGTSQGKIGAGSYSDTGVTGSATGGADLSLEFNTGTLSLVQLELGDTATPFEHRSYGDELARCQRYTYVVNDVGGGDGIGFGTAKTSTQGIFYINFPCVMRSDPSAVSAGSPQVRIDSLGTLQSNTAGSSIAISSGSAAGAHVKIEGFTGLTSSMSFPAKMAGGSIIFDAEL